MLITFEKPRRRRICRCTRSDFDLRMGKKIRRPCRMTGTPEITSHHQPLTRTLGNRRQRNLSLRSGACAGDKHQDHRRGASGERHTPLGQSIAPAVQPGENLRRHSSKQRQGHDPRLQLAGSGRRRWCPLLIDIIGHMFSNLHDLLAKTAYLSLSNEHMTVNVRHQPSMDTSERDRRAVRRIAAGVIAAAFVAVLLMFATTDLGSRSGRSSTGPARVGEPLFGFDGWIYVSEVSAVVVFIVAMTIGLVQSYRQGRATIGLLMVLGATSLYWLDPLANWAPYAVYDPRLMHWPVNWPWANLSTNIEPLFGAFGYVGLYLVPAMISIAVFQRMILPRCSPTSVIRRHPLAWLALVTAAITVVYDAFLEIGQIRAHVYQYSQVPPFGSIFAGTENQFPLLWESGLTAVPLVCASLLWWRDDTGKAGVERLAMRLRPGRPTGSAGLFALIFTILSIGYIVYLIPLTIIHRAGWASELSQPWRYCESRVYDPNGRWAAAGERDTLAGFWPGPYIDPSTTQTTPVVAGCRP